MRTSTTVLLLLTVVVLAPSVSATHVSGNAGQHIAGSAVQQACEETDEYDVIELEAENYDGSDSDQSESPFEVVADETASGGEYVRAPNATADRYLSSPTRSDAFENNSISYTFDTSVEDEYVVWGRTVAPNGTSDSFWVAVDDGEPSRWFVPQSTEWEWRRVNVTTILGADENVTYNRTLVTTPLAPGEHTLHLGVREAETRLDTLVVTNDPDCVPASDD
ncbi:hypothetical protein [Halorussus amylolyticus]|uniref:hypothetical protein n=1 Tax=Halorussus amylolyticus TaxID=1126242 RepID=UPI001048202A|nr:hypothetical protein [Halorussus amylolyticus]